MVNHVRMDMLFPSSVKYYAHPLFTTGASHFCFLPRSAANLINPDSLIANGMRIIMFMMKYLRDGWLLTLCCK